MPTEFTSHSSINGQVSINQAESDRNDIRNNQSRESSAASNHFNFMSSSFLINKERDKLCSQPAATAAYMNQSSIVPFTNQSPLTNSRESIIEQGTMLLQQPIKHKKNA